MSWAELLPALSAIGVGVGHTTEGGHVVGAGDGDHQVLGADIALTVIDLGDKGEGKCVALAQPVEVGRGRVVVPADDHLLAVGIGRIEADGAAGNQRRDIDGIFDRQRAESAAIGLIARRRIAGDRDRQRVAEVLVGDADGAVDLRNILRRAVAGDFENCEQGLSRYRSPARHWCR